MSFILNALKRSEQERTGELIDNTLLAPDGILSEGNRSRALIAAGSVVLVVAAMGSYFFSSSNVEPPLIAEVQEGVDEKSQVAAASDIALTPPAIPVPQSAEPMVLPLDAASSEALVEQQTVALAPIPEPIVIEAKPKLTPHPIPLTSVENKSNIPPRKPKITAALFPAFPPSAKSRRPKIKTPPVTGMGKRSDAPTFNKRGQEFEREGFYDLSIKEYTQAILLDPAYAEAYYGRGWAHEGKGNHEQAIRNFSQAIEANPSFGQAYYGRGWAHEQMDHSELAIEEYAMAIKVMPAFADAYLSRGILYFYNGRMDKAENNFSRALEAANNKLSPFALLWLYISQARSGKDGIKTLKENSKQMNLEKWPGIMISMFLKKEEPWRVTTAAEDVSFKKQLEKECIAFFFIGQYYLINANPEKSAEYFRKTLNTGITNYRQYEAAEKELRIMGMLR